MFSELAKRAGLLAGAVMIFHLGWTCGRALRPNDTESTVGVEQTDCYLSTDVVPLTRSSDYSHEAAMPAVAVSLCDGVAVPDCSASLSSPSAQPFRINLEVEGPFDLKSAVLSTSTQVLDSFYPESRTLESISEDVAIHTPAPPIMEPIAVVEAAPNCQRRISGMGVRKTRAMLARRWSSDRYLSVTERAGFGNATPPEGRSMHAL